MFLKSLQFSILISADQKQGRMSSTSEKYLRVAAGFSDRINHCPDDCWSNASPCDGWTAANIVEHVIGVHRGQLAQIGADVSLNDGDPLAHQWQTTCSRFVDAMSDPERAGMPVSGPMGSVAFKQMAGSIVLHDLLVHTWDFAVATHQSADLDEEAVRVALEKMTPMSEFIRGPGMFGPAVIPPLSASLQTQFLCFVGRSPLN
jgi:uncharacterized protein (TIGR03086 family)